MAQETLITKPTPGGSNMTHTDWLVLAIVAAVIVLVIANRQRKERDDDDSWDK